MNKMKTFFLICMTLVVVDVSLWAGMHLRVGGVSTVTVDGSSFSTPVLTPEASVKVGWVF